MVFFGNQGNSFCLLKRCIIKSKQRRKSYAIYPCQLVEGRSQSNLTNMMKEITEVHKAGAQEHIHVIINEMKQGTYAVNGDWK